MALAIASFYGLKVMMPDHSAKDEPFVEVEYPEYGYKASLDLKGRLLSGSLPHEALKMVRRWMRLHRKELHIQWDSYYEGIIIRIPPLL